MFPRAHPNRFATDEELVAAIQRGQKMALAALYDRHIERLLALAYRMVGLRDPAEEVVKLALQAAWSNAATYQPDRGSVRAWLLGITHEKAVDVLREAGSAGRLNRGAAGPARRASPADELPRELDADRQDALMAPAARAAEHPRLIELAYFGGYDRTEIAEMLGVSSETVCGRMRAALEQLDQDLPEGIHER